MHDYWVFEPDRRWGVVFHICAILLLIGFSSWGIWQAAHSALGPTFLVYLFPLLLSFFLVPLLAYRLYSLLGAYYHIERDGIRIRWGWRIEDIPTNTVTWISTDSDMKQKLPLPWLRWPGSVLGQRRTADGNRVEFAASRSRRLIVFATQDMIYAISPTYSEEFMQTFQDFMEMGTLSPLPPRSIYPSFLLARVWRQRSARFLILVGLTLNLALLVWVSLAIPERSTIYLSFASAGDPVPAVRLLLIPVISSFFFLVDLFLGFFFFRRAVDPPSKGQSQPETDFNPQPPADSDNTSRLNRVFWNLRTGFSLVPGQYLAHLLWASGAVVPALFILAIYFILGNLG